MSQPALWGQHNPDAKTCQKHHNKSKENCKPISLINTDSKSFIKYQHINLITCKNILHSNRVGVIQEIQGCFNSWEPMSIIHHITKYKKKNDGLNRCKIDLLLFFTYYWTYVLLF